MSHGHPIIDDETSTEQAWEVEVVSLPAGQSYALVMKHHVHAYPARYRRYKKGKYVAFRQKGGFMDALYHVEGEYRLNPYDQDPMWRVPIRFRERVMAFVKEMPLIPSLSTDEEYHFIILSVTPALELPHRPRMERNAESNIYFTEAELSSGKLLVLPASRLTLTDKVKE